MSIVLVGSTSGSVTLQEPAVAGTTVLTLPAVTGTVLTDTSPKAGNVLQVVQGTTTTNTSTTSTSYVNTSLSASITPSSSSSKILIIVSQNLFISDGIASGAMIDVNIVRASTQVIDFVAQLNRFPSTNAVSGTYSYQYLDSPSTTSATTYKTQFKSQTGASVQTQYASCPSVITLLEIAA
jgi:hypothetical protein